MPLEDSFDLTFAASQALREKQIQQSYRPIIGIHKWFARRPGTLFRNLLLAEFDGGSGDGSFWRSHSFEGVIADPFMGGGTPLIEANRLGFHVVGVDINPMAYWIVRQSFADLDVTAFEATAATVAHDVEAQVGSFYTTKCTRCGDLAPVKYFLWVKRLECPECGTVNDLFPGHLLAKAERHPRHVLCCPGCSSLVEFDSQPHQDSPAPCPVCDRAVTVEGPARRGQINCSQCDHKFRYPGDDRPRPLDHRLWAIEYHCASCRPTFRGRFFKAPDDADFEKIDEAEVQLEELRATLPIPLATIPAGDETNRLHRWGYTEYRQMFSERQLLGLGLLLKRICAVEEPSIRHALLTVFSDSLRYQNLLCRYDTYALKCQDIFSVHGFPVGLVVCENNVLGIPRVGSGSFRHFVEKYARAKRYCQSPFETLGRKSGKRVVPIDGESIAAKLVDRHPEGRTREAYLSASPAAAQSLPKNSLDGVFTDPPYFGNVQYAELMDFCFVWLREGLRSEVPAFEKETTRSSSELTGNTTLGRDLEVFAGGLSEVFVKYASALKPRAPFVFTFHHNVPDVYGSVVMAILDSGLACTATLPAPAEMTASLHIRGTSSSILDSVFVCRRGRLQPQRYTESALDVLVLDDCRAMVAGGVRLTDGDVRCIAFGHAARLAVGELGSSWDSNKPVAERLVLAQQAMNRACRRLHVDELPVRVLRELEKTDETQLRLELAEEEHAAAV